MARTLDHTKWVPIAAIAVSVLALVVSIASATFSYLSYSTTREYSEINIEPWLESTGVIFAPPRSQSHIVNKGRGPANITKVEFLYDGKPHVRKLSRASSWRC